MKPFIIMEGEFNGDDSILGVSVPIKIGGVNGKLYTPQKPENGHELLPPKPAENTNLSPEWGWGTYHKTTIRGCCIEFPHELSDKEAIKIKEQFQEWEANFFRHLCIRKNQGRYIEPYVTHPHIHGNRHFPQVRQVITIVDRDWSGKENIRKDELEEIAKLCSEKKKIKVEWELILNASIANERGRNRTAIIDACSAMEIFLHKICKDTLTAAQIPSPQELLKEHRGIKKLATLMFLLKQQTKPPEFETLGNTRNKAAHAGVFPEKTTTRKLIHFCERFMKQHESQYWE